MKNTRKIALFFILGIFVLGVSLSGINASPLENLSADSGPLPQPITYDSVNIGKIKAEVIRIDLNSSHVSVRLHMASEHAGAGKLPHEPFPAMIAETRPTAAIVGTYYDTRTFHSVGTLVSNGELLEVGTHGIAVCFDENNRLTFEKVQDWTKFPANQYKVVIATGPTLLENGHVRLFPRAEKYHDPSLFRPARRSALGVTKDNQLILAGVSNHILFRDMAWVMKKLGAVKAVALDGGSAAALYYRGNYLVNPRRSLTNVLEIDQQQEVARDTQTATK